MSLYDSVRDLPLTIERYALDGLEQHISSTFLRKTTLIRLSGGGEEGVGEDVTYEAGEQDLQQTRGAVLPLSGAWTLHTFSELLETLPLFDHDPEQPAFLDYRRWAFESAALDLALRQAGQSLDAAVERTPKPLTFVVSMRLGESATTDRLHAWLGLYPGLRFKLDATPDWTEAKPTPGVHSARHWTTRPITGVCFDSRASAFMTWCSCRSIVRRFRARSRSRSSMVNVSGSTRRTVDVF